MISTPRPLGSATRRFSRAVTASRASLRSHTLSEYPIGNIRPIAGRGVHHLNGSADRPRGWPRPADPAFPSRTNVMSDSFRSDVMCRAYERRPNSRTVSHIPVGIVRTGAIYRAIGRGWINSSAQRPIAFRRSSAGRGTPEPRQHSGAGMTCTGVPSHRFIVPAPNPRTGMAFRYRGSDRAARP